MRGPHKIRTELPNLVSNTTPIYFQVYPLGLQQRHIVC
jgi:hypothetical protein